MRTLILLAQSSFSSSQAPFSLHLLLAILLLDHFVYIRSTMLQTILLIGHPDNYLVPYLYFSPHPFSEFLQTVLLSRSAPHFRLFVLPVFARNSLMFLLFSFLWHHIEKSSKDQPWDTPAFKYHGEEEDPAEENEGETKEGGEKARKAMPGGN